MYFCSVCQRVLTRSVATGAIVWLCPSCGFTKPGTANDMRLGGMTHTGDEPTEMYRTLIRNSAFDPTCQQVRRLCVKCGRDYMSQIRVGAKESIVFTCRCGVTMTGAEAAAADSAPKTGGSASRDAKTGGSASRDAKTGGSASRDAKTGGSASRDAKMPVSSDTKTAPVTAKSCAWVVLLMLGDSYLPGALVVGQSLRNVATAHKIVCMVSPDVSNTAKAMLKLIYDDIVPVDFISAASRKLKTHKQDQLYDSWKSVSYTKWAVLGLTQYEKVILVDADKILLRNCDELFNLQAPAGTFSTPWWKGCASPYVSKAGLPHTGDLIPAAQIAAALPAGHVLIGSMVLLRPDAADFAAFKTWLAGSEPYGHAGNASMLDEQSIAEFYAVERKKPWTMIGAEYNAVPWKHKWLMEATRSAAGKTDNGRPPQVMHYFGAEKPWNMVRSKWVDLEPWWCLAKLAIAAHPTLAVVFNAKSATPDVAERCAYCLDIKADAGHYLLDPAGRVACPNMRPN